MTAETYVKKITGRLKCSGEKRKEIRQQLLSDVSTALENGETLAQIMVRMGAPASVAAEFNENMPPAEIKKYKRTKTIKTSGLIVLILALLAFGIYWVLPKGTELEKGGIFKERMVKAQMQNVIEWVGSEDYEQLKKISIPLLKPTFENDSFSQAKASISEDWGAQKTYGKFYMTQLRQMGKNYAVGQVTVTYENTSVTYTLTFDRELKLAGIYIK